MTMNNKEPNKSNFNLDSLSVLVNLKIEADEKVRKALKEQKALEEAVDFITNNYKKE